MSSMNGDDDAVFDVTVKIQKERIRLKLLDRDDVPVVERRLIQADVAAAAGIDRAQLADGLRYLIVE